MSPPAEHHGGVPPISDADQRPPAADLADLLGGQLLSIACICSTSSILCHLRTLGRWRDECRDGVLPIGKDQYGRTRQTPIGRPLRMVGGDGGRVDPASASAQYLDDARSPSLFALGGGIAVCAVDSLGLGLARWYRRSRRSRDDLTRRRFDPRVEAPAAAREEVAQAYGSWSLLLIPRSKHRTFGFCSFFLFAVHVLGSVMVSRSTKRARNQTTRPKPALSTGRRY